MTFTTHGHHVPGTPHTTSLGEVVAGGCGGVRECDTCIHESAQIYYDQMNSTKQLIAELPLNTQIYVECELQVQHEKRMYTIGKALVDMEALKKIKVEATENHQLGLVIASHFRFEPKE
jgi:hypothetical protein